MHRSWLWSGLGLGVIALGWGAWSAIDSWRCRAALDLAKREMARGLHVAAAGRLVPLSARWPDWGEVGYLLGVCESSSGCPDAALAAWARVPAGSDFFMPAALRGAQVEMDRGRFAAAEQVLLDALRQPQPEALGARHLLSEVLWHQGRYDELVPLFEANWEVLNRPDWPNPADAREMLRSHVVMDLFPLPIERIRATIDRAETMAPDDDRVWLARAHLAILTGQFADAERRLDACRLRRPDDPAVWRARLEWARATGRVDEVRRALARIPAQGIPPGRVCALRAWFAARSRDEDAERRALEQLAEADPGDTAALEQLAELDIRGGRADRAAELRRRKAERDRTLHRYRNLIKDGLLERDAMEMSRLAEVLGRRFEARAFLTLAARRRPADSEIQTALARVGRGESAIYAPGQTLADLLATELGPTHAPMRQPTDPPRGATPEFRDDGTPARLAFVFDNGESPIHQLPEMASGGVGLLDYDGDGRLDVYVVQGGHFPPCGTAFQAVDGHGQDARATLGDRLFRNRGDGTFEDVTRSAGIAGLARGYGHGVAVGDVDNDGHPDLFLTRWRSYALYRNRGDGTFEDVTAAWGLGGDRDWPTSSAFADLDNDGDLDLYVCHYAAWDPDHPRLCRSPGSKGYITCDPHIVASLPDHVFRNDGGRFVDVTADAGLVDPDGRGLGVVAADLDDDGQVDLYVANDGTANYLFLNRGGFRFEEVGHQAGVAANAQGGYQAGMGIACGDLDGDGRLDLAVTNFFGESTSFFQSLGGGLFADRTASIGLAAPSRYLLGFGAAFLDANNDGSLDLITANGHVMDSRPQAPYAMPLQLLLGGPGGRLVDISSRSGPPFLVPHLGRGLAAGDLDNDGRVDVLVVAQNEPLVYLHNRTEGGHAMTLRLEGTRSNRDAVGARVTVEADGRRWAAQRAGGGSYQSASDPRLHFGLGAARRVDRVEVRWPSGRVDLYAGLEPDAAYLLREGDAKTRPLENWDR
jgi:tetratricopeptide (TPR) repeat protein